MLISPPFLINRANDQLDGDWVDQAMQGGVLGHGAYPVSYNFGWHGGIHLEVPPGATGRLPVRAIADGTVVYVREPTKRPNPVPEDHPLNYRGGWTSNGCVVIRHETEIGADANGQATAVTYYSITMHLYSIQSTVRPNRPIYRKDEIGQAGYIYGEPNKIHFEIICDDANLQRLIGRTSGDLNIGADGRIDALYGEMYFRLNNIPVYAQRPSATITAPTAQPVTTLSALYVGLRYAGGEGAAGGRGDAYLSTYREDGTIIGTPLNESAAEYNLYTSATAISAAYTTANAQPQAVQTPVPAPSAVYELLRFGRVIGPDALNPATTPHWRKIRYEDGEGWVNLNTPGITKFSDADFPHWSGWQLIDDSADRDSRCDSPTIKNWLSKINGLEADVDRYRKEMSAGDAATNTTTSTTNSATEEKKGEKEDPAQQHPNVFKDDFQDTLKAQQAEEKERQERQQAEERQRQKILESVPLHAKAVEKLQDEKRRFDAKMLRMICKIPTEWEKAAVDHRWGWLKEDTDENPAPLSDEDFLRLREHIEELAFWEDANIGISSNHWHFHPREFIKHFRKCGWLSAPEFVRLLPGNHPVGFAQMRTRLTNGYIGRVQILPVGMHVALNMVCRKYLLEKPLRRAHFWGQIMQETDQLQTVREYATGAAYQGRVDLGNTQPGDGVRFRGRGVIQLTGRVNYERYGVYRGANYTTDPNNLLLETNAYAACDASTFYWVAEQTRDRINGRWRLDNLVGINRRADTRTFELLSNAAAIRADVSSVTRQVNRAELHLANRISYFQYAYRHASDTTESLPHENLR